MFHGPVSWVSTRRWQARARSAGLGHSHPCDRDIAGRPGRGRCQVSWLGERDRSINPQQRSASSRKAAWRPGTSSRALGISARAR